LASWEDGQCHHKVAEPRLLLVEVRLKLLGQFLADLLFAKAYVLPFQLRAIAVPDVLLVHPNPRDVVEAAEGVHRERLNRNRRVNNDVALGNLFLVGREKLTLQSGDVPASLGSQMSEGSRVRVASLGTHVAFVAAA
jgi:hypothetical protein